MPTNVDRHLMAVLQRVDSTTVSTIIALPADGEDRPQHTHSLGQGHSPAMCAEMKCSASRDMRWSTTSLA